jgi:hypothetical protein
MKPNLFLFFLILISACEKPVATTLSGSSVLIDFERLSSESSMYEIVKLVPLETKQNNLLSDNLSVKISNNQIFIFDEQVRDAVHMFDSSGRYLKQIVSVGESPESVTSIEDFLISNDTLEILSSKGDYSEIAYISLSDSRILKKLKLQFSGFSFEKIEDKYFVYSSYNLPFADFRISKLDRNGVVLKKYLKNDYSGVMLPVIERNFHKSNNTIFFTESFNNSVYELSNDAILPKYIFDFNEYAIPKDFFDNEMMNSFDKISRNGFFSIINHYDSDRFFLTKIFFQQEGAGKVFHILSNKEKKIIVKKQLSEFSYDLFKYPVGVFSGDIILFVVSAHALAQNFDLVKANGSIKINKNSLNSQDNPVLIFAKFPTDLY